MKRKGIVNLAVIFVLIAGVIGFAIIDTITTDTLSPATINQTVGTANATGYLDGTLTYTPLTLPVVYSNGTIETGNVTVAIGSTSLLTTDGANNFKGATVLAYYSYDDPTYLSGSLSRTIISYVVPIGLLAVLAVAAGVGMGA